jgi:hypothetical protein
MRSAATSDGAVEWHSTVERPAEVGLKGRRQKGLERARWLEMMGLDTHIPARRCDEEAVTLKQDLVEAASACEALGKASSCCAHHDSPHRTKHQTEENKQNELSTDLSRQ